MLKRLFTSGARIKLLTVFLLNPEEEYFIRELTRMLNEQINSVRRELDNLKKMGLLRARVKNRKKYYHVNKNFIFLEELRSIFIKAMSSEHSIARDLEKTGDIKLLVLSGVFIDRETESVDMLIVGNIDREKLGTYITNDLKTTRPVRYTVMSEEDYLYRLNCHDKFISDIISKAENKIPIKKL